MKLCTVSTFHLVISSSNISSQTFFAANGKRTVLVNLLGLFHPETVTANKMHSKRRPGHGVKLCTF